MTQQTIEPSGRWELQDTGVYSPDAIREEFRALLYSAGGDRESENAAGLTHAPANGR